MPGFTPQTDVQVLCLPIDKFLIASPLTGTGAGTGSVDICLLGCPDQQGYVLELLSVGYVAHTLPSDNGAVNVDIEFIDDSDGDSVNQIFENFDLTAGDARVVNMIWQGSQILDPGDVINAEFTTDGSITAGHGQSLIVEFRVLKRS
jgi:hypothetical protein